MMLSMMRVMVRTSSRAPCTAVRAGTAGQERYHYMTVPKHHTRVFSWKLYNDLLVCFGGS